MSGAVCRITHSLRSGDILLNVMDVKGGDHELSGQCTPRWVEDILRPAVQVNKMLHAFTMHSYREADKH